MANDSLSQNRRRFLQATGLSLLAGLAGCAGEDGDNGDDGTTTTDTDSGSDDTVYSIGMADSLTGSLSAFGERNQRGMELALADVNDAGVKGGTLEIIVEDTQSESQTGVSAAQKLVNQNEVPLMVGAVGSGVSTAIHTSVIQGTDVVQISQNSTSPELTNYPDLLRTCPPGGGQSRVIADTITEDGHDSLAIAWVNNDYGQGITDSVVDNYEGEVVYNSPHDQGQSSYSNVITSMDDAGADAWLFVTYQPEFATMAQEAFDLGLADATNWYGGDSVKGPNVLEQVPEGAIDGMKIVVPSAAVEQDNYKDFASRFVDEFGDEPTSWSTYTYDAIITAALSIEAADEFTGAALSEVVRDVTRPDGEEVTSYADAKAILEDGGSPSDIDYQGVSGPIDLDENGDPKALLQIFEIDGHEYVGSGFEAA